MKYNLEYVKDKAELVYCTGEAVVQKEYAPAVIEELEKYNGVFYGDIEMNGLVLIQKG